MSPEPSSLDIAALPSGPWRRNGIIAAALVVGLGVLIILAIVGHDRAEEIRHSSAGLSALLEERSALLTAFLAERAGDAFILAQRTDIDQLAMGDPSAIPLAHLQRQLDARIAAYGYHSVDVLDRTGRMTAHAGAPTDPAVLAHAARGDGVDFVLGADGRWWLSAAARLPSGGVVLLSSDPSTMLWPLIQYGTIRHTNARSLLYRPAQGDFVPLSPQDDGDAGSLPSHTASIAALAQQVPPGHRGTVRSVAAGGQTWLTGVKWLPKRSAALIELLPQDDALHAWRRNMWSDLGLAAGAVLVVATLAAFAAARRERRLSLQTLARDRRDREREHRFQRLVENASDLIIILGADGRVTYHSPSSRTALGYTPEELVGERVFDRIHPDDLERARAMFAHVTAAPDNSGEIEVRLRHRDGSWRDFAITGHNALAEPGIEGIVVNGRDVTAQVSAARVLTHANADLERRVAAATEELRAANQALASVAQTKDEFLASVSHELRTPLHAVLGITEAIQENVYGALNDRQLQAVQTIEASGRDLLALINDVLDVAKIEAGRLDLDCQPFAVDSLCQSSLRLLREAAAKKHLTLDLRLDPDAPQLVADARRLKQVLVNLLSNAVKFTPDGGRIEVATAADRETQRLEISVSDSGIGIAPENLPKLFQPFRQIDARLAREYSGTGLGLALVRRLVELHGGSVSVESRPGEGSRFIVSLPWDATPAAETAAGEPGPAAPVALVADDSAASLAVLVATLRGAGYRVETAREGADAVALARVTRPAVVVLGARLPGLDTLDVVRRLRDDPDLAAVPIVVLAALVLPGDRERCDAAGVDLYLTKPVPTSRLLDRLAALLHDKAA